MKIGIYGGSFNPIHFGHLGLAKWVVENTDLDELWLMVSPNNPLKDKNILADEQERLTAARETVKGIEGVVVSDFEFALPRPNYTAYTLRELAKAFPQHQFTLIIGEDNLGIFHQWKESQYILDNYRIFVYPRHGCPPYATPQAQDLQILKSAPYFDISSTELRKNLHI